MPEIVVVSRLELNHASGHDPGSSPGTAMTKKTERNAIPTANAVSENKLFLKSKIYGTLPLMTNSTIAARGARDRSNRRPEAGRREPQGGVEDAVFDAPWRRRSWKSSKLGIPFIAPLSESRWNPVA